MSPSSVVGRTVAGAKFSTWRVACGGRGGIERSSPSLPSCSRLHRHWLFRAWTFPILPGVRGTARGRHGSLASPSAPLVSVRLSIVVHAVGVEAGGKPLVPPLCRLLNRGGGRRRRRGSGARDLRRFRVSLSFFSFLSRRLLLPSSK
ncbi:hypothetical protein NL676_032335 [Syzygium grande]|nr:hypothetical protein NL676_032335 [Syzygium grande]